MTNEDYLSIQKWLENPSFEAGVLIYDRLGKSGLLKRMLKDKKSEYLMSRLSEEFKKLLQNYTPSAEQKQEIINVETKIVMPSEMANAPQIIKDADAKRRNIYNEYLRLHGLLKPFVHEEERRKASLRILDIFDEMEPLWELINYYNVNLKLPESKSETVDLNSLNIVELNQLYETAYKYVRKYKDLERKKDDCIERINNAETIKKILLKRDAFFHERLVFPVFN